MLHLSPESGQWVTCPIGDDEKCELAYHAPVKEGEISVSLLWETYAAEELCRVPTGAELGGGKLWRNADGLLHREYDLPAAEWTDGTKEWWVNGKLHREDDPAREGAEGTKSWWINGMRHRTDGPAIEYASGSKEWYKNGQLHRTDGPAVEHAGGRKEWWKNGKFLYSKSA